MAVNTYGLREVSNLTFYSLTTNKPFLYMDYALTSTNEHSMETVYAKGGQGSPKRIGFDGNKESTLVISSQIIDWRFISLLSGATVTTGSANIFKREELVAAEDTGVKITLSATPVADTVYVFPLTNDAVAGEDETITVSGTTVTITSGVDGTTYVAYYQAATAATAEKISFDSDVFPTTCKIIGDTLIKNEATGNNESFQMIAYKAKPMGNFSIVQSSEGEPTTLEITFDLLADSNNQMIDYIKY